MKRIVMAAVVFAGLLMPAPGRAASTVPVFMSNLKFCATPVCATNGNVTVVAGDTVAWVYADGLCTALAALGCFHTTTRSTAPTWNSGPMPGPGGVGTTVLFQRTFSTRGSFFYICSVHGASMSASIIVT